MTLERRHIKALQKKARRGFAGFPLATVAFYGPDDRLATKVAVGIITAEDRPPDFMERWFAPHDVRADAAIGQKILTFIREHGARSVVMADRIIGCPHEAGIDYPQDAVCPQCPFWAHRDRWSGETVQ